MGGSSFVGVVPHDLFVDFLSIVQPMESTPAGDAQLCGRLVFYPELSSFGNEAKRIRGVQESIAQAILEQADPIELSRRLPPGEVEQDVMEVELEALGRLEWWREPLRLGFAYVHWEHSDGTRIAHLPALGIEVVVSDPDRFDEQVRDDILFALNRMKVRDSLFDLALLMRGGRPEVQRVKWNAYPLSPVERHERGEGDDDQNRKVLPEVGNRLNAKRVPEAFEREAAVRQLARMLAGRRATSVLLVGEAGCGKTAVVHQLCREAAGHGLGGRPMWQTSGSRIVAGMTGFGDWQERCRKIVDEAKDDNALIYFGNLFELLQVGQSSCSSESVGSYFRGALVRGEFLAVTECTPRQLALIEQLEPRMLDAFRQLAVEPSTAEETRSILKQHAGGKASRLGGIRSKAIDRVLALHQRYAGYSALPGKTVRFVDRLLEERDGSGEPITAADVDRAFGAETGLPEVLIDESAALDPVGVEEWFRERLIGQDGAVALVVDAVSAIKARVTRPGKPLASFFFVGPTGVGKTELAKTLARYFYGSKERLIRLDMSEFSAPGSAGRLVAAGRLEEEGVLTAQVRDEPFSVVLLDEFEKADASVYDLFLQVLGEARLTDGAGRLGDFSNAIIILTSNLGAREFRVTRPGFFDPDEETGLVAVDHFTEAVKQHFRPEFFNRIDRVVPFLPLSREAVRAVVRRELTLCDGRDGLRNRNLSLVVQAEAVERLAELGYDPRYGARPVKRAIERHLLGPLGQFLCERNEGAANGFVDVGGFAQDGQPGLHFVAASESSRADRRRMGESFRKVPVVRRLLQRLGAGSFLSELHSEFSRLERQIANRHVVVGPDVHARYADLAGYLARFGSALSAIRAAEEDLVMARVRHDPASAVAAVMDGVPGDADFRALAIEALALTRRMPARLVLAIRVGSGGVWPKLAGAYRLVAEHFGCDLRAGVWRTETRSALRNPVNDLQSRPEIVTDVKALEGVFSERPGGAAALGLELTGGYAALRFASEGGLHVWVDEEGERTTAFLDCFQQGEKLEEAWMTRERLLDYDWSHHPARRTWNAKERLMRDARLGSSRDAGRKLPWQFGPDALVDLIERLLLRESEAGMRS